METLTIRYKLPNFAKFTTVFCSLFILCICLYGSITEALANRFNFYFYANLFGVILGISTFLLFARWQAKPQLSINNNALYFNLPKAKNKTIQWSSIKDIAIGGGHLKITTNLESIFIDLGTIKYSDISQVKSKIVEICDSKGIIFHND